MSQDLWFRRRPIDLRAWQITMQGEQPRWVTRHFEHGKLHWIDGALNIVVSDVGERRQTVLAPQGDWLLEDPNLNIYPCVNRIFDQLYERIT